MNDFIATLPCKSLVELFLSLDGGQAVREMVLQEEDAAEWTSSWLDVFPHFMKAIGQLLWPIGNHMTFMEFLMERFQPLAIQGYVRLQQNWYVYIYLNVKRIFLVFYMNPFQV